MNRRFWEREYTEETTVEERGKVYIVLGESVGATVDPAQEELENSEPKSRKRPLPEDPSSKAESAPWPRLSKTEKKVGRPLGASKLKKSVPMPDAVSEERDDGLERVCRWKACEDRFTQERIFVSHVEAHMREDGERQCWKCLWEGCTHTPFDAYYKLQAHVRSHTKEKPFVCKAPGCDAAYSRMENLKVHTRLHTGEKLYECSICKMGFSNVSDKARHENQVHSVKKKYLCGVETCGKGYTDPSSLRKHIRLHHPKVQSRKAFCLY